MSIIKIPPIRASNNVTFQMTLDFSQVAAVYNVANGVIRMQAKSSPYVTAEAYGGASDGSEAGAIAFNAATNQCVFSAPLSDVAQLAGPFVADCVLELPGGIVAPLFCSALYFAPGVTRGPNDSGVTGTGPLGDTVTIDGWASTAPMVLPVTLTSAIAAAQASQAAAEASAADAAGPITLAQLQAALSLLPVYSGTGPAPVPTGQWFINGTIIEQAQ